jgi:hypothetical protein
MTPREDQLTIERPAPVMEALEYEAPFLIEKLVKERIVDSADEAQALFDEAKRYIVLVRCDGSHIWEMHSLRVDEAWHQFVLFTKQYSEFCERFFGRYVHHSPSNSPDALAPPPVPVATFDEFRERYEELFGVPLPDVWLDHCNVTTSRRVTNPRAGMLTVRVADDGMVELVTLDSAVLMSVNEFATDALAFIARTGAFYVRELPGDLTDDEKVALVATLVQYRILRAAG